MLFVGAASQHNCPSNLVSRCGAACDTPPEELMGVNGTFGIGQQGGDGEYPPSLTCSWHLRGQEHQQLRAWFNWIDLEQFVSVLRCWWSFQFWRVCPWKLTTESLHRTLQANCESADYVQVATDEGVILETACGNSLEGTTEVHQAAQTVTPRGLLHSPDAFPCGYSLFTGDSTSGSGHGYQLCV